MLTPLFALQYDGGSPPRSHGSCVGVTRKFGQFTLYIILYLKNENNYFIEIILYLNTLICEFYLGCREGSIYFYMCREGNKTK